MNPVRRFRKRLVAQAQAILQSGTLSAYWHINDINWGDGLNPILLAFLSHKKPRYTANPFADKYMVVGSILHLADQYTTVWGAGFIARGLKTRETPRAICAVRGPYTHKQLLENGVDSPEVYGDPALLLPFFFNPITPKRYDVGIIPHYADKLHPWLNQYRKDPKVLLIDVQGNHKSFVESVKSCDLIVSSSLHGIICADAYSIPSIWVEFSDSVVGGGFKFLDYFASVQREPLPPMRVTDGISLGRMLAGFKAYRIGFDASRLMHACPFLSSTVKRVWDTQFHKPDAPC